MAIWIITSTRGEIKKPLSETGLQAQGHILNSKWEACIQKVETFSKSTLLSRLTDRWHLSKLPQYHVITLFNLFNYTLSPPSWTLSVTQWWNGNIYLHVLTLCSLSIADDDKVIFLPVRHTHTHTWRSRCCVFEPLGKRLLQAESTIKEKLCHILPFTLLNWYCYSTDVQSSLHLFFLQWFSPFFKTLKLF